MNVETGSTPVKKPDLFATLNDLEMEIGQTTSLVDATQFLMMDHFSTDQLNVIHAMHRALEAQQVKVQAVMAKTWECHFAEKRKVAA